MTVVLGRCLGGLFCYWEGRLVMELSGWIFVGIQVFSLVGWWQGVLSKCNVIDDGTLPYRRGPSLMIGVSISEEWVLLKEWYFMWGW